MKRVLLSSVAALAVFAAAAPVFAEGPAAAPAAPAAPAEATSAIFGPNHKDGEVDTDTSVAATPGDLAKDADSEKIDDSKAKTGKANNAVVDKDGVLREKGPKPAAKSAAAGQKALPKTSAAK
ncbi:LPKTxAVK-anchored surface protein [uncultured Streptococcus sp.]|uniref:LPKTxAVK-anchored surface protein n=1 Tax=uncultured Streptococcus sp. TaxID=83427 RepID=UPI001A633DCA|nr:LPKTxAVK-anchored surface protein [uncultured Streptococcus sp.]VTY21308.1 Uncharacterised protein [uncultured Streptococcus sp.]